MLTINMMTKFVQEAVDRTIAQGEGAISNGGACKYRYAKTTEEKGCYFVKCAIGQMLTDEWYAEYQPDEKGLTASQVLQIGGLDHYWPSVTVEGDDSRPVTVGESRDILSTLQQSHDIASDHQRLNLHDANRFLNDFKRRVVVEMKDKHGIQIRV